MGLSYFQFKFCVYEMRQEWGNLSQASYNMNFAYAEINIRQT